MNEPRHGQGLTLPPEIAPKSDNLWRSTLAFLRRDVKSFFSQSHQGRVSTESLVGPREFSGAPATVLAEPTPVESLVDEKKLSMLAFRRDALDWRDNFHVNLLSSLRTSHDAFVQQVQVDLANTSLFRVLIARESDQVLQDSFTRLVRLPLMTALRDEEAKLEICAVKWGVYGKADLTFDVSALDAECASLRDIGFKPSNRDQILSRCHDLILGPVGLMTVFGDQGLRLSRKLIDTRTP